MASQVPAVKGAAFNLLFTLYKNDGTVIANPNGYTIKESIDGAAVSNISATSQLTEVDTTYGLQKLALTATMMNGDAIWVYVSATTSGCVPFTTTIYTAGQTLNDIDNEVDTLTTRLTATRAGYLDQLEHIHDDTNGTYNIVNSGTYGNSAIKTAINLRSTSASLAAVKTDTANIYSKVDTEIGLLATSASLAAVASYVSAIDTSGLATSASLAAIPVAIADEVMNSGTRTMFLGGLDISNYGAGNAVNIYAADGTGVNVATIGEGYTAVRIDSVAAVAPGPGIAIQGDVDISGLFTPRSYGAMNIDSIDLGSDEGMTAPALYIHSDECPVVIRADHEIAVDISSGSGPGGPSEPVRLNGEYGSVNVSEALLNTAVSGAWPTASEIADEVFDSADRTLYAKSIVVNNDEGTALSVGSVEIQGGLSITNDNLYGHGVYIESNTADGVHIQAGDYGVNIDTNNDAITCYQGISIGGEAKLDNVSMRDLFATSLSIEPYEGDAVTIVGAVNVGGAVTVDSETIGYTDVETALTQIATSASLATVASDAKLARMWATNKREVTSSEQKLYDDSDTLLQTQPLTDDGSTFTRGKAT